jgi:hypothetical protein
MSSPDDSVVVIASQNPAEVSRICFLLFYVHSSALMSGCRATAQQPRRARVSTDKTGEASFHHHQKVSIHIKIIVSPSSPGGIGRTARKDDVQPCCTAEVSLPRRKRFSRRVRGIQTKNSPTSIVWLALTVDATSTHLPVTTPTRQAADGSLSAPGFGSRTSLDGAISRGRARRKRTVPQGVWHRAANA